MSDITNNLLHKIYSFLKPALALGNVVAIITLAYTFYHDKNENDHERLIYINNEFHKLRDNVNSHKEELEQYQRLNALTMDKINTVLTSEKCSKESLDDLRAFFRNFAVMLHDFKPEEYKSSTLNEFYMGDIIKKIEQKCKTSPTEVEIEMDNQLKAISSEILNQIKINSQRNKQVLNYACERYGDFIHKKVNYDNESCTLKDGVKNLKSINELTVTDFSDILMKSGNAEQNGLANTLTAINADLNNEPLLINLVEKLDASDESLLIRELITNEINQLNNVSKDLEELIKKLDEKQR